MKTSTNKQVTRQEFDVYDRMVVEQVMNDAPRPFTYQLKEVEGAKAANTNAELLIAETRHMVRGGVALSDILWVVTPGGEVMADRRQDVGPYLRQRLPALLPLPRRLPGHVLLVCLSELWRGHVITAYLPSKACLPGDNSRQAGRASVRRKPASHGRPRADAGTLRHG